MVSNQYVPCSPSYEVGSGNSYPNGCVKNGGKWYAPGSEICNNPESGFPQGTSWYLEGKQWLTGPAGLSNGTYPTMMGVNSPLPRIKMFIGNTPDGRAIEIELPQGKSLEAVLAAGVVVTALDPIPGDEILILFVGGAAIYALRAAAGQPPNFTSLPGIQSWLGIVPGQEVDWEHSLEGPRASARARTYEAVKTQWEQVGFNPRCLLRPDGQGGYDVQLFAQDLPQFEAGGKLYTAVTFVYSTKPTCMGRNCGPINDRFTEVNPSNSLCQEAKYALWKFLKSCLNGGQFCNMFAFS